jgi:hypothetical protein
MKKFFFISFLTVISSISYAQSVQDMLKSTMGDGKKPAIKPEYKFSSSATYQMTSGRNDKPMTIKYYYSSSEDGLIGTEMNVDARSKTRSVADFKNKAMIMMMDEQKMVMSMSIDFDKAVAEANNEGKFSTPTKTGRTKTILGYNCEEWVSESSDMKTLFWITNKAPFAATSFYKYLQDSYRKQRIMIPSSMSGFPMEMEGISKDGKKNFKSTCVAIDSNTTVFSTAGYKTM